MKKVFFLFFIVPLFAASQKKAAYVLPGSIKMSVYPNGRTLLLFSNAQWDLYVAGTGYCSQLLSLHRYKRVVIEIGDKQFGQCKRGIGFGCSIFDDLSSKNSHPVMVNNFNRFASALLKKKDEKSVMLIFIDKINWVSLRDNQE